MKTFGKASLLAVVCMVFLFIGLAKANTLELGSSHSNIWMSVNGTNTQYGGGPYSPSYLDGVMLDFLYCVDLFKTVTLGQEYATTEVNRLGNIYGAPLPNTGQVAWLLDSYAVGADSYDEKAALQAAIWHVVNDGRIINGVTNDITIGTYAPATQQSLYDEYLLALGTNTSAVANYSWITPGRDAINGGVIEYQGLVGSNNPVPVPAAAWLLGAGLVGLVGIRRKVRS